MIIIVIVGWVLFYFTDIARAIDFLKIMFGLSNNPLYDIKFEIEFFNNVIFLVIAALLSTPLLKDIYMKLKDRTFIRFATVVVNALILLSSTVLLVGQTYNPFLYYRF